MQKQLLRRSRRMWLSPQLWKRRLVFWTGAVAVGCTAVLFAMASEFADRMFHQAVGVSPFLALVITPLGLALVVYLTKRFFPGSEGSGIPQTIAALKLPDPADRQKVLSLRIASGKIGLTVLGLFSGASVGREGPTVQVGAAIMHALSRFARFPGPDMQKGLILAGGAAGVAAAFNTPLAGVVFAIEEMSRSFEQRTSGTVLTAVILAGVASLALLGNYTYFGQTGASLSADHSWIAVFAAGIVGGLLGGGFSQFLITVSQYGLPGRLGVWMRTKPVLFAAGCGFVLALIGLLSGSTTYGTGYHEAKQILEGSEHLPEAYGIMKLLATIVSYVSGIPGGVFAPSLAIGAGIGSNLADLMPYVPAGAVILLGMVAYFAGVVQAPITAFVIVMEMTANHEMVVPLMAASVIAYGTSRIVCRKPLYKALAEGFLKRANGQSEPPPR